MAIAATTAVTLRIRGDNLDPEEITRLLGAEPDRAAKLGGTWYTPKGRPIIARTGFWHLRVEDESSGDLDRQILNLLLPLSQDLAVWQDLTSRFDGELFCGMMMKRGNEGTGLNVFSILVMAQRGLRFELDVYGPPRDYEEEDEPWETRTVKLPPGAQGA